MIAKRLERQQRVLCNSEQEGMKHTLNDVVPQDADVVVAIRA